MSIENCRLIFCLSVLSLCGLLGQNARAALISPGNDLDIIFQPADFIAVQEPQSICGGLLLCWQGPWAGGGELYADFFVNASDPEPFPNYLSTVYYNSLIGLNLFGDGTTSDALIDWTDLEVRMLWWVVSGTVEMPPIVIEIKAKTFQLVQQFRAASRWVQSQAFNGGYANDRCQVCPGDSTSAKSSRPCLHLIAADPTMGRGTTSARPIRLP